MKEGYRWEPADLIAISISADHRVIDGATCARFAAKMKLLIEHPNLMLLNMHWSQRTKNKNFSVMILDKTDYYFLIKWRPYKYLF